MSTIPAAPSLNQAPPVRVIALEIGEPIAVSLARFGSPGEAARCLKYWSQSRQAHDVLVLALPLDAHWELAPLLDLAANAATRIILTAASPALRRTATPLADFRHSTDHRVNPFVWEPDPGQAIVGGMLELRAGDALHLLWPASADEQVVRRHVTQGIRWRASLENPDDGIFHYLPADDS